MRCINLSFILLIEFYCSDRRIPGFHSGSRDVEGVEGLMWGGCPQETCEFSIEELRVGAFSYAVELNLSL